MGYHLMDQPSRLAFIQSRVSAESFIRDECALSAAVYLADRHFNVHMEKKVIDKKVDIIIVPTDKSSKDEDWNNTICFELKMAWPGGLGECSSKIRKDFDALAGKENSWIVVLYFAFTHCPPWAPFGCRKRDFDEGLKELIDRIGHEKPDCEGSRFQMGYSEVKGEAQLLGWRIK